MAIKTVSTRRAASIEQRTIGNVELSRAQLQARGRLAAAAFVQRLTHATRGDAIERELARLDPDERIGFEHVLHTLLMQASHATDVQALAVRENARYLRVVADRTAVDRAAA